uniref:Glutathione S-transferase n=1 Tax=Ananas comosus var. bracteatus TaxID=296719 RepID=A0A6V7PE51_ANACO|nr:unnamed protein product [Ananas comosus var. bracteatus]
MDPLSPPPPPPPAAAGGAGCCDLKLLGSWASSYTHRVQLALKLKGLEFEYAEEDLSNKSPALLQSNPSTRKSPSSSTPPAAPSPSPSSSSTTSTTPSQPSALSSPPTPSTAPSLASGATSPTISSGRRSGGVCVVGEAQMAAVAQVHENLKLIENELREGAFKGKRFFGGDGIGILDIVLGCGSYWLAVFEEVTEAKLVDPDAFPSSTPGSRISRLRKRSRIRSPRSTGCSSTRAGSDK